MLPSAACFFKLLRFQRQKLSACLFWLLGAGLLLVSFIGLRLSEFFSYEYLVAEMPLLELVLFLFVCGCGFLGLRYVLLRLPDHHVSRHASFAVIAGIFLIGIGARGLLLLSEPVLEDDYQRYLWDGGVLAAGLNPYKYSPLQVLKGDAPPRYLKLRDNAYPIVERINHPDLRTIYPPGAEAAFAGAHYLSPWSLSGWRAVIVVLEIATFLILLAILNHLGRGVHWVSLYWWNPLVIKEMVNSAHMEAVLVPLLMGGVLLVLKRRMAGASLLFSLAASVKFWPALLLPLVWRQMGGRPFALLLSIVMALLIGTVTIWPYLTSGLNQSSGLVAYAQGWKTNSLIFPLIEMMVSNCLSLIDGAAYAPLAARGLVAGSVLLVAAWFTIKPGANERELLAQLFVLVLLIFLFSPAQFPWYFLWVAPFMVIYPLSSLCLLVPMMSFYYFGFYLMVHDLAEQWRFPVTALSWFLPLALLIFEMKRFKERRFAQG